MTLHETNIALMDILAIPKDQRKHIIAITVEIRPDAYPQVTIEQAMIVNDAFYTSDVEFELIGKGEN